MFKKTLTNASHLISGTILAQLIAILSLPLLSRLYKPGDFAIYALVAATSTLLSIFLTLRFEVLLLKAKTSYQAYQLVGVIKSLILISAVFLVGVSTVALLAFSDYFYVVFMSSTTSVVIAAFNVGQNLFIRNGEVSKLKYALVSRVTLFTALSVILSSMTKEGMVYAFLMSYVVCDLVFFRKAIFGTKASSFPRLKRALFKEKKNVLFYTPHSFYGALILHAPTYILTAFYTASTVGLFNMANRLVSIPMSVLTGALNKISFNEFSKEQSDNKKKIFFVIVSLAFAVIYLLFSLLFWLFGETIVEVVLGSQWSEVYIYVLVLMPWIAFRTVAGVFAFASILKQRQGTAFLFEIVYGCLSMLVLVVYAATNALPERALLAFSITGAFIVGAQLTWYYALLFKER
ncbi:oligosaccharide flippase family protein [Pseudoalteromonas sp. YIC-656]|uniref:lipopolysaccharide biosynthesis protein n=1 Tax=Pseudoalteromonas pernae TaxID=3118054 RepID=UPI0032429B14